MAGLRARNNVLQLNGENESRMAVNNGKAAAVRATRTRAAMSEIGNQAAALTLRGRNKETTVAPKANRLMAKQRGTSSLRSLQQPKTVVNPPAPRRSKRLSSEEMEVDDGPSIMQGPSMMHQDVEMEEAALTVKQPEAFSTKELGVYGIEDIDGDDAEDPQLVVEYVHEIYEYMRQMEQTQGIRKAYLDGRIGAILPKMRGVLVEWLVEVHQQFSLLQETLYLSVAILDRYLQASAEKVSRKQLQLVGVTAMFIAAKYEEMYAPEIGDFVYITDNAYTATQIREMETKVLAALRFDLGRPLPLHFLRRNSKAGQVDATAHTLAKYVMELTLMDYGFAHVAPSEIAASALAFALKTLDPEPRRGLRHIWTPSLAYYAQYSLEDIAGSVKAMAALVLATAKAPEKARFQAVRKKYATAKFGKISDFDELVGPAVEAMANGRF